jgi:hypothetical protein
MMDHAAAKLTDAERTIVANALTVAICQFEKDAEGMMELALHGRTTRDSANALAAQFRQQAAEARQLRDKMDFMWSHLQFEKD